MILKISIKYYATGVVNGADGANSSIAPISTLAKESLETDILYLTNCLFLNKRYEIYARKTQSTFFLDKPSSDPIQAKNVRCAQRYVSSSVD